MSGPFFLKYSQTYTLGKYELFEEMSCTVSQNDPQFVKQRQQDKVRINVKRYNLEVTP